jgi:hypothetical protein
MIGSLHQGAIRDPKVLSDFPWLVASKSFGDIAWRGCGSVADLIAKLEIPGRLTPSNQRIHAKFQFVREFPAI